MDGFVARWAELKKLLEEALTLEGDARAAFLKRVHLDDPSLGDELVRLLEIDAEEDLAIDKQLQLKVGGDGAPPLPETIGPYRIIRRLGSGGMGTVYLARRVDDQMETQVALKVLNPGAASVQAIRRFQLERQILAELEHPNIARLQEGGSVDGMPFFAMEYVRDGEPITSWCRRRKLDLKARLRLFEAVARAVHFAHRNQVIHRDLKPVNILVGESGIPKLLDFGIARLEREDAETRTLTSLQALTPEYASPEQLAGQVVTTSSDIYALGLLLFELLTGTRPFSSTANRLDLLEAMGASLPKPSTRVVALASGKLKDADFTLPDGWDGTRLGRQLAGDLDNIVLMALRREPERRYDSAMEMAQDVERYLLGFPVHARKESLGYTTWRFLGRHKPATLAAAALLVGLVAISGFGLQRQEAARAARNAAALSVFTTGLMRIFDPYDPHTSTRDPKAMLRNLRQKLNHFDGDPQTEATLLHATGKALLGQSQLDEGEAVLKKALALRMKHHGAGSLLVADTREQLGNAHFFRGSLAAAERHYRAVLKTREKFFPVDHPEIGVAYMHLGRLYVSNYEHNRAIAHLKKAREILRPHQVGYQSAYLEATKSLGIRYFYDDRPEAEPLLKESHRISETYGMHLLHAESLIFLGRFYFFNERSEQGRAHMESARHIFQEVLVGDHHSHVTLLTLLADLQRFVDHNEARKTYVLAREMSERLGTLETPDKIFLLYGQCREYMFELDLERAMQLDRLCWDIVARCRMRPDLYTSNQLNYAIHLVAQNSGELAGVFGDWNTALKKLQESWDAYNQLDIYQPSLLIPQLTMIAPLEAMVGDRERAFAQLEIIDREMPTVNLKSSMLKHVMYFRLSGLRALVAFENGDTAEAECRLLEDLAWIERTFGPDGAVGMAKSSCRLAGLLQLLGRSDEADGLLVQAEDLLWRAPLPDHYMGVDLILQIEAYLAQTDQQKWSIAF